jgi:hypothetical protein
MMAQRDHGQADHRTTAMQLFQVPPVPVLARQDEHLLAG